MEHINNIVNLILGAAFGGLTVFFSLRHKLKQQQQNALRRRSSLLEEVAQHIGKVSHVFSKYSSLVNEVGPKAERISPKQQQELDALSEQLVEVYEEVSVAESKLLLLGEKRLQQALKLYTGKMAQYRKQYYPGRYLEQEQASHAKKELGNLRIQFYDILSERYDETLF